MVGTSEKFELPAVFQMTLPVRIACCFIQPGQNVSAHNFPIRDCIPWHEVGTIASFGDWQPFRTSQFNVTVLGVQPVGLIADLNVARAPDQLEDLIAIRHG